MLGRVPRFVGLVSKLSFPSGNMTLIDGCSGLAAACKRNSCPRTFCSGQTTWPTPKLLDSEPLPVGEYSKYVAGAAGHLSKILSQSFKMKPSERVVVLADEQSDLSKIIRDAYCNVRPDSTVYDVDKESSETMLATIGELKENDLVVGVQTWHSSYLFNEYRLRIELFRRKIKSADHVHLGLIPHAQYAAYIDSLAFNTVKEAPFAHRLKERIDACNRISVKSTDGSILQYTSPMESCLLNIGDYSGMENVGGTYPVGEVFSEPKDLSQVNGEALVFGYPNPQRYITIAERPFKITINQGILTDYDSNAPADFVEVLSMIRDIEGIAMIREFGVGLNAAMSKSRHVNDVTAFERQLGLHVSVGKKHNVFKKQGLTGKKAKFHIDLFLDIDKIDIDGKPVFANNAFVV